MPVPWEDTACLGRPSTTASVAFHPALTEVQFKCRCSRCVSSSESTVVDRTGAGAAAAAPESRPALWGPRSRPGRGWALAGAVRKPLPGASRSPGGLMAGDQPKVCVWGGGHSTAGRGRRRPPRPPRSGGSRSHSGRTPPRSGKNACHALSTPRDRSR